MVEADGSQPAAFGRLRVETSIQTACYRRQDPAAFGRLRVETRFAHHRRHLERPSRLRAAAC